MMVDTATGEMRDIEQQRLFGEWGDIYEYEVNVSGSGLDGNADFEIGQDVTLTVQGRVIGMQHIIRKDPDDPEKLQEILVRRAVIRAHSAKRA